jgi:hypothetical protein
MKGERTMKRFSEYSFKDPAFSLEDIGAFKCEMIDQLACAIDDFLFRDGDVNETSPENRRILAFLYGIREKAAEITEIMEKLDTELGEMGVGMYAKKKQPEAESAAQIAEPQRVTA